LIQNITQSLESVLPRGHFDVTETGLEDGWRELSRAKCHLVSAKSIQPEDPVGSFQLTYDAARKTLQALLFVAGFRINAKGGHYAFVRLAECGLFESQAFLKFREMRIARNQAEYPSKEFEGLDESFAYQAMEWARSMISEIEVMLASMAVG